MANQNQNIVLPAPPRYTGQPQQDYLNQVNRWLDSLYQYVTGVTYLRANGLYLPAGFPATATGLSPGEVYADPADGTLKRVS